jgi:serine-type D-Ala-D-Ala carboxypeptidase (penicillin-binding protein 5/6)
MLRYGLIGLVGLLGVLAWPVHAAEAPFGLKLDTIAEQAVLIDVNTKTVLFDKAADVRMPTSSMSKMMTVYLVFDALKQGKLKLDTLVTISEHAWKMEGSRMFAQVGTQVKVEDLIRGVIIQSGNDASAALAEAVAGTEPIFANRMNELAAKLGMTNSHFVNATGLPDPQHYSTPHDLARLGMALHQDFPEYYHYFGETEFTYNKIKQGNRNPLLYRNMGVDGIKTGHAEAAGFGLTAMAERKGRRLILVVNGLKNMQERADEPARLLEYGYHEFNAYTVATAGQKMATAPVWLGQAATVELTVAAAAQVTLPVSLRDKMKVALSFNAPVTAPVVQGQVLGKLLVTAPNMPTLELPLQAATAVPKQGFFAVLLAKLGYLLTGKTA